MAARRGRDVIAGVMFLLLMTSIAQRRQCRLRCGE